MSYLSRLDSALRYRNCLRDHDEVVRIIRQVLESENLSSDEEIELLDFWGRLLDYDYINPDPIRIIYCNLHKFFKIGDELYSYFEHIGVR